MSNLNTREPSRPWGDGPGSQRDDWFTRLHSTFPRLNPDALREGLDTPLDPRALWTATRVRIEHSLNRPPVPASAFAPSSLVGRVVANWSSRIAYELRASGDWSNELASLRERCGAWLAARPNPPEAPSARSAWIREFEDLLDRLAAALEASSATVLDLLLQPTPRISVAPMQELEDQARWLSELLDWLADQAALACPRSNDSEDSKDHGADTAV